MEEDDAGEVLCEETVALDATKSLLILFFSFVMAATAGAVEDEEEEEEATKGENEGGEVDDTGRRLKLDCRTEFTWEGEEVEVEVNAG